MMILLLLPVALLALGVRFRHINKAIKSHDRSMLLGESFMLTIIGVVVAGILYLITKN